MGFYKDCGGLVLFIICHIVFILQFLFIYEMTDEIDNKQNRILIFHKFINYIFLFLSVYSHIKTSITNPGSITTDNNREIIEFYYQFHETFIKRALKITEKKTPELIKKIILGQNKKVEQQIKGNEYNDEEDENISDKDEYNFEPKTSINDTMKKTIEEKYNIQLSRCTNCFVIRPINSHHCSVCHKCFIEHDHHCPWVNNCIALFNKKVFILFLFYSLIEIIYSDILFLYYSLYKNIHKYSDNLSLIFFDILAIVFGLILAISSIILLYDQYDTIILDCKQYDNKRRKLLEISTIKHQFQMIFGGIFSYKWLLPFYPGGNSDFLQKLSNYLKLERSLKNKKLNNNNNKGHVKDKYKHE